MIKSLVGGIVAASAFVMQMPEAGRQIIYGVVIVAMLLLYGRAPASR